MPPAARVGDTTIHGGVIMPPGCPTVLIGGVPAARIGDMHTCPMQTPAPTPIPHVGGPITGPGAPTVLIGGMPAAVVGDMCVCTGPPDTIAPPGCPTVMISSGGGGGGGGGAGGGGGGSGEGDSGAVEQEKGHFLNVKFTDKAGKPITGVAYTIKSPDNKVVSGSLAGQIKKGGVSEGNHEISLKAITRAEWSPKKARDGEKVKMCVETAGFEPSAKATFEVWQRDYNRADRKIQTISDIPLNGEKAEAEWTYSYQSCPELAPKDPVPFKYSSPLFYFIVRIENVHSRSGFLEYKDWIEIELRDEDGNVIANQEYVLYLPDGTVRSGKLDQNGYKKETKIPPGYCRVTFPGLY